MARPPKPAVRLLLGESLLRLVRDKNGVVAFRSVSSVAPPPPHKCVRCKAPAAALPDDFCTECRVWAQKKMGLL